MGPQSFDPRRSSRPFRCRWRPHDPRRAAKNPGCSTQAIEGLFCIWLALRAYPPNILFDSKPVGDRVRAADIQTLLALSAGRPSTPPSGARDLGACVEGPGAGLLSERLPV